MGIEVPNTDVVFPLASVWQFRVEEQTWGGLYTDVTETFCRATVMVSICPSVMWVQTSLIARFGLLNIAHLYCLCRIWATSFIPGMWVSCMHTMSKRLTAVASMSALCLEKPSILIEAIDSAGPEGGRVSVALRHRRHRHLLDCSGWYTDIGLLAVVISDRNYQIVTSQRFPGCTTGRFLY